MSKISLLAGAAALAGVGATVVRAEAPKAKYVPSTEQVESGVLVCMRQAMVENQGQFQNVTTSVQVDSDLAKANGSSAPTFLAEIRGTITSNSKSFAFRLSDAPGYRIPALEMMVAPSFDVLETDKAPGKTRVDTGTVNDGTIQVMRAFDPRNIAGDYHPDSNIDKNADPERTDIGWKIGKVFGGCVPFARYKVVDLTIK